MGFDTIEINLVPIREGFHTKKKYDKLWLLAEVRGWRGQRRFQSPSPVIWSKWLKRASNRLKMLNQT